MKKMIILFLSTISLFFVLMNNAQAQCPTSVLESTNGNCLTMVWPVPPNPLPASINVPPDTYPFFSGAGTSGNPAIYASSTNGCNNNPGFTGTLTYPGHSCTYVNGVLTEYTLPLNLMFFELGAIGEMVELQWMIHGNHESFEIERSSGNNNWTVIGEIKASRKSQVNETNYTFKDYNPAFGDNYYRLKILNWDGAYEYSGVISYFRENKPGISFYPNPVTNQLYISGQNSANQIVKIEIYDLLGSKLKEIENPGNSLDFSEFQSGTYLLKSSLKDGSEINRKVLK